MGSGSDSDTDERTPVSLADVELDDADRARIAYLAGGELTESEAERVVRFGKVPREHRRPEMLRPSSNGPRAATSGASDSTTDGSDTDRSRACGDIRRRMRAADRPTDVIDAYPDIHPSSIFQHAEGRCGCDTDEPPTTSPRVKAAECFEMRETFRSGATKRDLMTDFHRSANAVNKHLFGRCDHPIRREPPTYDVISTKECAHLRQAYRANETASVHDVAAAYGISSSIAHKHLRDRCDHDVDVDPIPPQEVTPDACTRMRRAFKGTAMPVVARIARNHDVTRPTADYHIFGRCACDTDEPPARRR